MKSILRLTGTLTLFCVLASALLAWVRNATAEAVQRAEENKRIQAVREVLPSDASDPEMLSLVDPKTGEPLNVYVAFGKDGHWRAAAFEGRVPGYGGEIVLMIGITADDKLRGLSVLSHQETPGLGANIESENFRNELAGRDLKSTRWKVAKDGGDIQAITAATISSRAVLTAVAEAIERLGRIEKHFAAPTNGNRGGKDS